MKDAFSKPTFYLYSFFYILAANATSIDVLSIPGEGQASPVQSLNITEATADMKLTISKITSLLHAFSMLMTSPLFQRPVPLAGHGRLPDP